ncbi:protein kinase domain-containing protein [Desulfovibrio ferrophilus]|uniref:Putative serine/threonine protein kinase n=1 Tax=Desulfovibrio ferrophilus TaxID=241368 RepID=A0A2Z6AVH4_9BACT|nr:protein kinase [Desulfovibrio ferrophilus]BBD07237.1 putative serine/threonine protein kinase [Desulfovibrio ferrophilus]
MSDDERRHQDRVALDPPGLAVLRVGGNGDEISDTVPTFVDVLNVSPGGVMVEAEHGVPDPQQCILQFFDNQLQDWRARPCSRVWEAEADTDDSRLWGMAFKGFDELNARLSLPPEDIDFLMRMSLLGSVPRKATCRLLNCLVRKRFADGETLVRQGEAGDSLFVLQYGDCQVEVIKDGVVHGLAMLHPGDVVGEMAVLTGEPRTASAVAQGDVTAWRLARSDFDRLAKEQPDLLIFLTELVANRFESSQIIADRTVAKYVIRHQLGKGEWSIVYRGVHQALDMPVAIKMMRHDMAMNHAFLRTFRQEANTIAKLRHQNIVQVFDIEELYRTVFIIMESLQGFSLRDVLERTGRIPAERAAAMLVQICSGLAYAHEQGVVHRDIKPANVFVQDGDRIKILDFGLACTPADEGLGILGTPLYAAPEQVGGCATDHLADMYSTGIMAYEMVIGQRPYPERSRSELMQLHRNQDIPDPLLSVPELPEPLREFIVTCCRRDPSERFSDMEQARALLTPLLNGKDLCTRRKMSSLYLFYPEEVQGGVNELMEELSVRAKAMGVELRTAEIKDV